MTQSQYKAKYIKNIYAPFIRIICAIFCACIVGLCLPAYSAPSTTKNTATNTTRYYKVKKPTRPTRKNLTNTAKNSKDSTKDSKEEKLKDALVQESIDRIQALDSSQETTKDANKSRNLIGDLLHIYISTGMLSGSPTNTNNTNSMSKEAPTCPNQLCRGDTTNASYQGNLNKGYALEIGVEHYFDKFDILGVRLFGEFSSKNGGLGDLISSSMDTSTNNIPSKGLDTIVTNGSTTTNDKYTFATTPQPDKNLQATLANNGVFMTFGFGGDIMANAPFDYWLRKAVRANESWWKNKLAYVRVGVFLGGGVEFGRFSQGDNNNKSFKNELASASGNGYAGKASNLDDSFFASGSGGFLRYGIQIYITQFLRINLGYKHNFYNIASERWYGYNGLNCVEDANAATCAPNPDSIRKNDPKSETLFRQKFVISRGNEWFLNFAARF